MKRYTCTTNCPDFDHKEEGYCTMTELELQDLKRTEDNKIICGCGHILKLVLEDFNLTEELNYIIDFGDNKISEEEFYEKFNKFINDNGWSIKPNIQEYIWCRGCNKELDDMDDKVNGYCYECIHRMWDC